MAEALLSDPATKVGALPSKVVELSRGTLKERIHQAAEFSPEERQTVATLETKFNQTAVLLGHGLSWETVRNSLARDKESIGILGNLIARGGQPTVTADENGEIIWSESVDNVPLADFKGIPMSKLAYDEIGEVKAIKMWDCRGNAVDAARRIHPRVKLTSPAESKRLLLAGLIQDSQSFPWLDSMDFERGNKGWEYGGFAWFGCSEGVAQFLSGACRENNGARFSLEIKKIEI